MVETLKWALGYKLISVEISVMFIHSHVKKNLYILKSWGKEKVVSNEVFLLNMVIFACLQAIHIFRDAHLSK